MTVDAQERDTGRRKACVKSGAVPADELLGITAPSEACLREWAVLLDPGLEASQGLPLFRASQSPADRLAAEYQTTTTNNCFAGGGNFARVRPRISRLMLSENLSRLDVHDVNKSLFRNCHPSHIVLCRLSGHAVVFGIRP